MKCPKCGKEAEMLFSDGCLICHEKRTDMLRASLERVESGTAAPPKPKPVVVPSPAKKKEPTLMPRQLIRWTTEECQQVATEAQRLFPGKRIAGKAIAAAQAVLPADRRKAKIEYGSIKKVQAQISGAKTSEPGRRRTSSKRPAGTSRRSQAPAVVRPASTVALSTAESLSDAIAQQLVGAVISSGVQAFEKAATRLRSITA